jgi:arginine deiminase
VADPRPRRAVYRFHPLFTRATFPVYCGDDDAGHQPATLEGGDIHVLGRGVVLIGMGGRTTAMGVEILARELFRSGQATTVIAVELPRSPPSPTRWASTSSASS